MKTRQLNIRLSAEEYTRFKAIALSHNMDSSEFFRAKFLDMNVNIVSSRTPATKAFEQRVKDAEKIIASKDISGKQDIQILKRNEYLNLIFLTTDEIADYVARYDEGDNDVREINQTILAILQNLQIFTLEEIPCASLE